MKNYIENYHRNFISLISSIRVTDNQGKRFTTVEGIEIVCGVIGKQSYIGGKLFFIGNGGSASIASHMAIDFWKNGGIQAVSFNDASLLTCISNDFGYKHVFEKPIEVFAKEPDIIFAISSSGKSENILRGVQAGRLRGCVIITLSGFNNDNPLSSMGNLNFYVPAMEYGPVEVAHQYVCHYILDTFMNNKLVGGK